MYGSINYLTANALAVNNKIKRLGNYGEPQEDFLYASLNEFKNSDERKSMLTAWDYYKNENDIKNKKRMIINRMGNLEESRVLTNTKMPHPFIKKLTKQKKDYLLKDEPTYKHEDGKVSELLNKYFTKKFHKKLKSVGRDSIVKGKAWMQAYYDEKGILSFKRIPSEQVIPFWADEDHTELDGIIRYYTLTLYLQDGSTKQLEKVEYHTIEGVWYYEMTDDGLKPDPEKGEIDGPRGHFTVPSEVIGDDGQTVVDEETGEVQVEQIEATWDKIPFVCFKYNAEEISLLNWVKAIIDDYDKNTSDTSDTLQDTPNNIKIVKNYDGADVESFNHNLNTYRTAFVAEDGDMKMLETKIDTEAKEKHLDRDRKDIFVFGNGVDTQETDLGNSSGVSLKFRTMDLATDCEDMGTEFESGLIELSYFVMVDAVNRGEIEEFNPDDIEVIFNTQTIINEQEVINMAKASVGLVSEDTILGKHPWVEDVAIEKEAVATEKAKREDEEIEYMKKTESVFGTNTPNGGSDD